MKSFRNYKGIQNAFLVGLLTFSVFLLNACKKDFERMNTNPNNATDENLQQDGVGLGGFFPNMQIAVSIGCTNPGDPSTYQVGQGLSGDIFSGYMATATDFGPNNSNYVMRWNNAEFNTAYESVMSGWSQVKRRAQINNPDFYAIALILKVAKMQRVTDIHGPAPYSKFGMGGFSAAYDSQEVMYSRFFSELDTAINNLTVYRQKFPTAVPFKNYDLVYGGDYGKWLKYANSLKLRLAMRIAYANPSLAKKNAEEAVASSAGLISTNAENANLQSANGITLFNPVYYIQTGYQDIRAGATLVSFLKGYNDPRLPAYLKKSEIDPNLYLGIRTGINLPSGKVMNSFSQMNLQPNTPLRWLTAAEVCFLRAEGALRGWNMNGTAKDFYEAGIQASFDLWDVRNPSYKEDASSKCADYVDVFNPKNNISTASGELSTITIKWQESDSFEKRLERIITQKWLAIFPDGQEAWTEFRRTGYPRVFPIVVNLSGGLVDTKIQIRRLTFPESEYRSNNAEVNKAITLLNGPDNGGTKLWWDKK